MVMDIRLSWLFLWPERQDLRKTMSECFRSAFGDKVAVIIDCFEVFVDRPSHLLELVHGLPTNIIIWSTF